MITIQAYFMLMNISILINEYIISKLIQACAGSSFCNFIMILVIDITIF